jgi:hypothetical protein
MRKDEILKANPAANAHSFHYKMKRKAYIKEFGSSHTTGTLGQKLVAFLIRILPKVGPLKALTFKDPGPKGEETFIKSFDTVLVHYQGALSHLHKKPLELPDVDYDTGKPTYIGEYELADISYAKLIENLEESKFNNLTANLKRNIVNFYDKADTAAMSKKYPKDWRKTYTYLQALRSAKVIVPDSLKTAKGLNYKLIPPTAADKQTGGQ